MPERITPNPVRKIGDDQREEPAPQIPAGADAHEVLQAEFDRALALKIRLSEEKPDAVGATARQLVASLEGMSRFALKMKLVTAAQSREMFAKAKANGLYDGWGQGIPIKVEPAAGEAAKDDA